MNRPEPRCTCYIETETDEKFGPFTLPVWLDLEWTIHADLTWQNHTEKSQVIKHIILVCPQGIQKFACECETIDPGGYVMCDVTVQATLDNDDEELVAQYIDTEIKPGEMPTLPEDG